MASWIFTARIDYDDEVAPDELTEDHLDLGALYYGDKHQSFSLTTVPGSIRKLEE
jgi:hypothetical protein